MPVALGWLLGERDLSLIPRTPAAPDVQVHWAHAIELEDPTPWLAGGELVLTTGLRMPRGRAEQTAYVDRLAEAGVAALGFGVGVRFATVPRAVVEQCEHRGLPLLEVPLPTPFIAVTQRVAQRLAHEQQQALQRLVTAQQSITRRSLTLGAAGVAESLARELHREVVLLDEHGRPLGWSWGPALAEALVAVLEPGRPGRAPRSTRRVHTAAGPLELHGLRGRAAHRGWLAVAIDEPLLQDDRLLVNHAVAVATLQLDRPREVEQARAAVGATILGLLLEHAPSSPETVRHLGHLGFATGEPVRLVWARSPSAASLADAVQAGLADVSVPHALQTAHGELMLLVQDRDTDAAVSAVVAGQLDTGQRVGGLGVSGPVTSDHAADALVQARRAGEVARDERLEAARFDTLTLGAVLSDTLVRERVQALTRSALEPLAQASDGVLLQSLRVFLDHNGSWESAARALGVHRHTMRHRMTRVEEITGLDLDVAHNRVVLLLALATRPTGTEPAPTPHAAW